MEPLRVRILRRTAAIIAALGGGAALAFSPISGVAQHLAEHDPSLRPLLHIDQPGQRALPSMLRLATQPDGHASSRHRASRRDAHPAPATTVRLVTSSRQSVAAPHSPRRDAKPTLSARHGQGARHSYNAKPVPPLVSARAGHGHIRVHAHLPKGHANGKHKNRRGNVNVTIPVPVLANAAGSTIVTPPSGHSHGHGNGHGNGRWRTHGVHPAVRLPRVAAPKIHPARHSHGHWHGYSHGHGHSRSHGHGNR